MLFLLVFSLVGVMGCEPGVTQDGNRQNQPDNQQQDFEDDDAPTDGYSGEDLDKDI